MKKLLRKIFPPSGYRCALLSYPALMVLMVAELVIFSFMSDHYGWDTYDYLRAADVWAAGTPDFMRTPIYPLFLWLLRRVFGTGGIFAALCALQGALMVVSAWYFRGLCAKVLPGPRNVLWLTAIYALLPSLQWTATLAMTEAPAIALTMILFYWLVRDFPELPTVRSSVYIGLLLIVLIFLRPMMICLLAVVGLWFAALSMRKHRSGTRRRAGAWCAWAVCVAAVLGYSAEMKHTWGVFTFSGVSVCNNFILATDAGILRPEHTSNLALRTQISRIYGSAEVIAEKPVYLAARWVPDVDSTLTAVELQSTVHRALAERPGEVAKHLALRCSYLVRPMPLLKPLNIPVYRSLHQVLVPSIGLFAIAMAIYLVWLIAAWRRGHKHLQLWLLWVAVVTFFATAVLGAMNDWNRLVEPAIPLALLLFGAFLARWRYKPGKML